MKSHQATKGWIEHWIPKAPNGIYKIYIYISGVTTPKCGWINVFRFNPEFFHKALRCVEPPWRMLARQHSSVLPPSPPHCKIRYAMYIYMCIVYIYIYIWMYVCIYTLYICICMYICICICICVCVCVCVCIYIYMYVCMYVYIYH